MTARGTAPAAGRPSSSERAPEGERPAPAQTRRVTSGAVVEIHLCARPDPLAAGLTAQARSMYGRLLSELRAEGAHPSDIVTEKLFFSDVGAQMSDLTAVRSEIYRAGGSEVLLPATTFIEQPPVWPGQLCEVQAFVLLPASRAALRKRAVEGLVAPASGRVVETGGVKHVFLANLTGGSSGDALSFRVQTSDAFHRAESALRREGLSFRDVVRTWIYLRDIDRDYGDLNHARREFFKSRKVEPAPASTGIRGHSHPVDRLCVLDVRAAGGRGSLEVRALHAPTLNEAPAYGSDFARGMSVRLADRRVLFISGTASIDTEGRVVRPGDIEGQVDRMLLNVEQLLASEEATFSDVMSAVTYLKRPEFRAAFMSVSGRRGFLDHVPNTLCVADICRPEWLCEIEAVAVLV